jgi:regulator of replication initiation timing
MQEVMRRDLSDKDRALEEANQLRRENHELALELHGLREALAHATTDREALRGAL